jgi:hypothetical protein
MHRPGTSLRCVWHGTDRLAVLLNVAGRVTFSSLGANTRGLRRYGRSTPRDRPARRCAAGMLRQGLAADGVRTVPGLRSGPIRACPIRNPVGAAIRARTPAIESPYTPGYSTGSPSSLRADPPLAAQHHPQRADRTDKLPVWTQPLRIHPSFVYAVKNPTMLEDTNSDDGPRQGSMTATNRRSAS